MLRADEEALYELLLCCCKDSTGLHPKMQEWFTAVVWNLALDSTTCDKLVVGFGKENKKGSIVEGLLQALMHHSVTGKRSGLYMKIKRNAISALGNIVADARNHAILFHDMNTAGSLALIPRLMNLVQDDTDSVVRRRAMRTIRCLASSKESETRAVVEMENFSCFLVNVIGRNVSCDDENDHDMQIQACQTVIALRGSFVPEHWTQLETMLIKRIETTTFAKLIAAASQCLAECKRNCQSSLSLSSISELFWKRLEIAVSVSSETHEPISNLLLEFAKSEQATTHQSRGSTSPLATPTVVNSLTLLLSESEPNQERSRNAALEVVLILVENELNKKPLAENEGLLSGLVNLCLMQPGPKNKDAAKRVILDLVPEI
jgi:hypothetical protein